ncbi:MAG: hypothetical protein HMLKMBBP_03750 [Planctomycetes bacterium]|nr:hypothetical protein [Planctomycetota bacterium]
MTRAVFILTAVLLLATSSFAGEDPMDPLRPRMAQQDQLASQGRVDEMVAEAKKLASDGKPESLYLLGRACGNAAAVKRAQGNPKDADDLLRRAQDAFEMSRDAGVAVYAPALVGLGKCARVRGDLDAAARELREALRVAPDCASAAMELAQVLVLRKEHVQAEASLRAYLARNEKDGDARFLLASLLCDARRWEAAESELRTLMARPEGRDHPEVRKMLGAALIEREELAEAAEHFEFCRAARPKDPESYRALLVIRRRQRDRAATMRVLEDMRRNLEGEQAAWASAMAETLSKDEAWESLREEETQRSVVKKLSSNDPAVLRAALASMRKYDWPAFPPELIRLLAPTAAPADVRALAVSIIGEQRMPATLPLLEVVLMHPRERDPDAAVRRAALRGISGLPTAAAVPVLWKALLSDDGDEEMREAAVAGLTALTSKSFRLDPSARPDAAGWAKERELWTAWWASDGTLAKKDAAEAIAKAWAGARTGRKRLAGYALLCMDDARAQTWRAGYDAFRGFAGVDFGATTGDVPAEERARILEAAKQWYEANGLREDGS